MTTVAGVHGSAPSDCGESSHGIAAIRRVFVEPFAERSTGWLLTYVQDGRDVEKHVIRFNSPLTMAALRVGLEWLVEWSVLLSWLFVALAVRVGAIVIWSCPRGEVGAFEVGGVTGSCR